jgi:DNA-binding SARP family transcriptional activator/WD40 repeat protein
MRIAVLGPLEVLTDDGTPVPVPGAKERLLLAVLAAGAPDVVSADRLMDTLWADAQPITARKSLQAHLVRLRSSLEPGRPKGSTGRYVVRRGAGYALALDRASLDALRMPDLAARGHAELATGHADAAAKALRAAVDLWRGEPYADWPDAAFAETERRRLAEVRRNAREGLLRAELALGRQANVLPELERLVAEEPLQERWWQLLMLALYRAGRQGDALSAGRRARSLLAEELGADPGPDLRETEAAILAQDPALLAEPAADVRSPNGHDRVAATAPCPYKGLAPYQAADAALFRGRQRIIGGLLARLVDSALLVVSGPSGAGKSSVVRAGLVPALTEGALPGSASWHPVIVTPGRAPVDVLADLTGDPPPGVAVVLVCDQFEELWAPGVETAERTAFLDAVLGLLDDGVVRRCVAVVRGDHVGRIAEHAAFAERIGGALVLVPALSETELREVVREPAAAVGLVAEPDLVDAVVADVEGQPGALPLLSTALVGTWERRSGSRLTLAGYLEAGGVAGALTRSAEVAYAALDDDGRDMARRLLVRLADVDEAGALVRRPVPLGDLDLEGNGGALRRQVVETFVNRRLLSVDGDRVEVAHEALLTGWPRLRGWLEDDAAGRAVRRHLAPAAREWASRGRPDEELYRGARLAAALDWAADPDADVTAVERRFLDASKARADAELTEARELLDHEVTERRRTRRLASGLAALLVVALVATVLAVVAQRGAERSSRASERAHLGADANRLAALSTTVGPLDLRSLLAAQGFRLADTPETRDALLGGLVEHRRAVRSTSFTGSLFGVELANEGRTLVIYAGPAILRWDLDSGQSPETFVDLQALADAGDIWDGWHGHAVSPTDKRTASSGMTETGDPWIRLTDESGRVRQLPGEKELHGDPFGLAFTPDGRGLTALVSSAAEGAVIPWRLVRVDPSGALRETRVRGELPVSEEGLDGEFSEDGSTAVVWSKQDAPEATVVDLEAGTAARLSVPARGVPVTGYFALSSGGAVVWGDGSVTLVDRAGAVVQDLDVPGSEIGDVALAPDGTWGVTVGQGGVVLWDVDTATGQWSERESLQGHAGDVISAEIDPSGNRLVTASPDNVLIVWDVRPDGGFGTAQPGLTGRFAVGTPAVVEPGRLVVVPTRGIPPREAGDPPYTGVGLDVAATFVDPRTGEVVDQVPVGDTVADAYFGASAAVSPDGSQVAVTSGTATTVLDVRTRAVVKRIELPPNGDKGVDGKPYPAAVVCCAVWSPDGSRLLVGTGGFLPGNLVPSGAEQPSGAIAVVDTRTWQVIHRVPLDRAPSSMQLDDAHRRLAVGSSNNTEVLLLDAATLDVIQRVRLSVDDSMWALAFSPDGRLLAGAGEYGRVHVIDTRTGQARQAIPVKEFDSIIQLGWLSDGRTVVAAGGDGKAVLLDVERALLRTAPLPATAEGTAGYTTLLPDRDDELVLLAEDRTGLRYPMDPSVWLREACAVAGRDLTRAEWQRYLPDRPYAPTCSDLG